MMITGRKRPFLACAACLWVTILGSAWAQAKDEGRAMSLKECVLIALQQSFDLRISALDQAVAASQVRAATGAYDPIFTATFDYSDTTAPGGFDTRTGQFVDSQTKSVRSGVGLSAALPTGGSLTVGASVTDTNGTSGGFDFSNASAQGPYVEFRQPLLENFAIDDIRLNIHVSRQGYEIATLALRQSMLNAVNRVEELYYDLVAARENVSVQRASLTLAEELSQDNDKRVALGALAPLEAAETRSQVASSRAALINSERFVRVAQNALKGVMVEDYLSWRELAIQPSSALSQTSTSVDFDRSWERAQTLRPDVMTSRIQWEQQMLILRRRDNQRLPQLDLTARAGVAGSANELSQVIDQVRHRDAPFYSVGLSLALPLTNRREKEAAHSASLQVDQARLRWHQLRQSVMIQIDDAISQAETSFQQLQATREARAFAEQALANERAKLARGASTNFVVLRLQSDLTRARSQEIQSLTDYNKALSRLRLVEGDNLDRYHIAFTPVDAHGS